MLDELDAWGFDTEFTDIALLQDFETVKQLSSPSVIIRGDRNPC
jgi:hypothetical protein